MSGDMDRFRSQCQVWWLHGVWYVFVNTKASLYGVDNSMLITRISGANPGVSIVFANLVSEISVKQDRGARAPGFPPKIDLNGGFQLTTHPEPDDVPVIRDVMVSHDSGEYSAVWSEMTEQLDRPFYVATGKPTEKTNWNATEDHPELGKMARFIPKGALTRFYRTRVLKWRGQRTNRKWNKILDRDVYEWGCIRPDLKLELISLIGHRTYQWSIPNPADAKSDIGAKWHRSDGPAFVDFWNVKENAVSGMETNTFHLGPFETRWVYEDREISATQIKEWAKSHGVILRTGACLNESAFVNEQDHMLWMMSQKQLHG